MKDGGFENVPDSSLSMYQGADVDGWTASVNAYFESNDRTPDTGLSTIYGKNFAVFNTLGGNLVTVTQSLTSLDEDVQYTFSYAFSVGFQVGDACLLQFLYAGSEITTVGLSSTQAWTSGSVFFTPSVEYGDLIIAVNCLDANEDTTYKVLVDEISFVEDGVDPTTCQE